MEESNGKYTILLGEDSLDQEDFWMQYQTIYDNFCLVSYIQDKIFIEIQERYQSVNYNNVYIDQLQIKNQKQNTLYLIQSSKQQFKKDVPLKITYYLLEQETIEKVKMIQKDYEEDIVQDQSEIIEELKEKELQKQFIKSLMSRFSPNQKQEFEEKVVKTYKEKLEKKKSKDEVLKGDKNKDYKDSKAYLHYNYEYLFVNMKDIVDSSEKLQVELIPKKKQDKKKGSYYEIEITITTEVNLEEKLPKPFLLMPFSDNRNYTVKFPKKKGEIQYFYQEPKNFKVSQSETFNQRHFSIALQGGGVKGISYIGAYKSFVEHFRKQNMRIVKQVNIKSVIGSSAGGILGLAICTGLDAEEIQDICIKYLQNVPKEDKKYPELSKEQKDLKDEQLNYLKTFIIDTKILSEDLVSMITTILGQEKIQQSLLEIMPPSIKELFTVSDIHTKKMCVLGLLMGTLMRGDKIGEIAVEMIAVFLKKKYETMGVHLDEMKHIRQYAKKVTLSQFYENTGIEFTCTSVDLNDQILRFFNHKTTPQLPVYKTVQMTGSFPVGFEAQKWNPAWGKYHIHYKYSRRQKSLLTQKKNERGQKIIEGHQFTDGGVLANFPVKYLDNALMREKYFFHPNNEKTIIFGFGLNYFNEFAQESHDPEGEDKKNKLLTNVFEKGILKGSIKNPVDYISLFGKLVKQGVKTITDAAKNKIWHTNETEINLWEKEPFENLRKVKLFSFVFDLLLTYMKSKDNLTKQCFSYLGIELKNNYIIRNNLKASKDTQEQQIQKHKQHNEMMASFFTKYLRFVNKEHQEDNQYDQQILKQIEAYQSSVHLSICSNLQNIQGIKTEDKQDIQNRVKIFQGESDPKKINECPLLKKQNDQISNHIRLREYIQVQIYQCAPELKGPDDSAKQKYFKLIERYIQFDKIFKHLVIRTYQHFWSDPDRQTQIQKKWKDKMEKIKKAEKKKQMQKELEAEEVEGIKDQQIGKQIREILVQNEKILKKKPNEKSPKEIVKSNLRGVVEKLKGMLDKLKLQNMLTERLIIKNNEQITYIINELIVVLQGNSCKKSIRKELLEIKSEIFNKEKDNIFSYGNLDGRADCLFKNGQKLQKIIEKLSDDIFETICQQQLSFLENLIYVCIQQKKRLMKKLVNDYKETDQNVRKRQLNFDLDQYELSYEVGQKFYSTSQKLFTTTKKSSTAFINVIKKCKIREIRTCSETFKQKGDIMVRFRSVLLKNVDFFEKQTLSINKNPEKQQVSIHLVFQSTPSSELYLEQICEEIQYEVETIDRIQANQYSSQDVQMKNKTGMRNLKIRIGTITASYYNSIAMFLFASDLRPDKLTEKVKKIKNLVELDEGVFKSSNNKQWNEQWSKSCSGRVFDTLKYFYCLDKICEFTDTNDKTKQKEELERRKEELKNKINIFMEDISEMIAQEIDSQLDPAVFQEKIEGIFQISKHHILKTEKETEVVSRFFQWIIAKYKDIILYTAMSTPFFIEQISYPIFHTRQKELWRGILICQVLKIDKIRNFIVETLDKDLHLDRNITLASFYKASSKKIKLNFTVCNFSKQCIEFFNYKSTPEMPLTEAILASMSVPLFMSPHKGKHEWKYIPVNEESDYKSRQVYRYFEAKDQSSSQYYTGDILNKIPLELVSNQKIKTLINGQKFYEKTKAKKQIQQEVFFLIYFKSDFRDSKKESLKDNFYFMNYNKSLKTRNISNTDLLSLSWNLLSTSLKYGFGYQNVLPSQNFKEVQGISQRKGIIEMYVNSHDKLIVNTYNKELVELPIRLNTLQFEKIGDPFHNSKLSNQAVDVIRQSQYVMEEKLLNTYLSYCLLNKKDYQTLNTQQLQEEAAKQNLEKIKKYHPSLSKLIYEDGLVKQLNTVSHLNYIYLKDKKELQAVKYMFIKIENFEPIYKSGAKHPYFIENQFYIRFLSYMSTSKDLHQKRTINYTMDDHLNQESFKEVKQEYVAFKYNGKNQSIFFEIYFPHILNSFSKGEKSPTFEAISLQSYCFEWKLPKKLWKDIDQGKRQKFEEYYRIPYSTYIKKSRSRRKDLSDSNDFYGLVSPYGTIEIDADKILTVQSVQKKSNNLDGLGMYCPDCYSSILQPIRDRQKTNENEKCSNINCQSKTNKTLFYECQESCKYRREQGENKEMAKCKGNSKFCLKCAYRLDKNSDVGHIQCITILSKLHTIQKLFISQMKPGDARYCDFCLLVPSIFFYDKQCDVLFCEECKKTLLNKANIN